MKIRGFEHVEKKFLPISVHLEEIQNVPLPKRGTMNSAGYDFFLPYDIILLPKDSITINTGVKAYMLSDEYLDIRPRSSLGFKYFLRLANTTGIIDADYYNNNKTGGCILIKVRNEGSETVHLKKGTAIAQGIFQKYLLVDNDFLTEGNERMGGIGSTTEE